jgi:hypothetical protein
VAKRPDVETYMAAVDRPLEPVVQAGRRIIAGVDPGIVEQIKWNAPSYSCAGEDLVTFNLRRRHHVHLVFHHPATPSVASDILEGDYPDGRSMAYSTDMDAVLAKQDAVACVVGDLIARTGAGAS